jgi:hypothetical protein
MVLVTQKLRQIEVFFYFSFIFLVLSFHSKGQVNVPNNQMWYTYNHQAIVSKHWGYQFDLNHRTTDFGRNISVLSAARVGIFYLTDNNHRFTAGYAWFGTHFQNANKNTLNEDRLWQQYHVLKTIGKTNNIHRIRVEQRWREVMPTNGATKGKKDFTFRPRYMYQHQGPIWPKTKENKLGVWWQGASEIMFHVGDGVGKHYFEQFRAVGGIVLVPSRELNLAILYQYINQFRPAAAEHFDIHTVRLTLLHQIDFYGKKTNSNRLRPITHDE